MLKSDLIERISSQNPHLYQRDVGKIVDAIFDQIIEACARRSSGATGFRRVFEYRLNPRINTTMAITQNTATKKPMSIAIQSNVAKKLRITITPSYSRLMVI